MKAGRLRGPLRLAGFALATTTVVNLLWYLSTEADGGRVRMGAAGGVAVMLIWVAAASGATQLRRRRRILLALVVVPNAVLYGPLLVALVAGAVQGDLPTVWVGPGARSPGADPMPERVWVTPTEQDLTSWLSATFALLVGAGPASHAGRFLQAGHALPGGLRWALIGPIGVLAVVAFVLGAQIAVLIAVAAAAWMLHAIAALAASPARHHAPAAA